jgi:EpsD family peptidyl-prolyl cis-trans isomerase
MNQIEGFSTVDINITLPFRRELFGVLLLMVVIGISACGNKEKKAGQALVRVNGEEITVLQINDELKRAGVKADQQEVATKQLLEKLIDRQLIIEEAMRNKIDRSPGVIQAIERAKAQIIAQAYLESITSKLAKPSIAEIDTYYNNHPEYFARRKQFDMQQIIFASKDLSDELKTVIDSAKTLDGVALWLDGHKVTYMRGLLSRSATELPEQMVTKMNELKKGELFLVNEGDKSILSSITDIKDNPVAAKNAAPQIGQYLSNIKAKEAADVEIKNLRSSAKIEYLNAPVSPSR